jgi:hypothetical protein
MLSNCQQWAVAGRGTTPARLLSGHAHVDMIGRPVLVIVRDGPDPLALPDPLPRPDRPGPHVRQIVRAAVIPTDIHGPAERAVRSLCRPLPGIMA